jgi:hypothetical protein
MCLDSLRPTQPFDPIHGIGYVVARPLKVVLDAKPLPLEKIVVGKEYWTNWETSHGSFIKVKVTKVTPQTITTQRLDGIKNPSGCWFVHPDHLFEEEPKVEDIGVATVSRNCPISKSWSEDILDDIISIIDIETPLAHFPEIGKYPSGYHIWTSIEGARYFASKVCTSPHKIARVEWSGRYCFGYQYGFEVVISRRRRLVEIYDTLQP